MAVNREKNTPNGYRFYWIIFVLPVLTSVYYALHMPVSYDEAWTFLQFTSKGFLASVSHYPAPNNHILHSVITNITSYIPGISNLFKLRISPIIINLLTLAVLFRFVKKYFNLQMAMTVTAIVSVLFLHVYYSYMSRGYGLVDLFFVLALSAAFGIINEENTKKYWIGFSLFAIFGFYAIPSFLYPFVTLNVFILLLKRKDFGLQVISNSIVVLVVLLLYLPILRNDGIGAITNNQFVQPVGFVETLQGLPGFYLHFIKEVTGIHWSILSVLMVVSIYLIVKSKQKIDSYFALVMVPAPVILLAIHHVFPAPRTFNYYGIVLVLVLLMPFRNKFKELNFKLLPPVLLAFQSLMLLHFENKIYAYEDRDLAINIKASEIIPQIIGDKKYLFNFSLLATNLEFELVSQGYKNYEIKDIKQSEMNADTISNYDYITIKREFDQTKNSKIFIATPYYNIYKKVRTANQ